jgi:hypothetical protein
MERFDSMKQLLAIVSLLAVFSAGAQEPPKGTKGSGDARVIFRGKMTGAAVSLKVNGESINLVGLQFGKGQTAYVQTAQDFSRRAFEKAQKAIALIDVQQKAITEAIKEHKGEKLKKALEEIRIEFEEKKKALDEDTVVVEGVITKLGKITAKAGPVDLDLGDKKTILVVGQIRDFDPKVKPTPPEAGYVVLEGELQLGKVDLGKEEFAPFSVRNGAISIAVTGKQAKAYAETKGSVRIIGALRVSDNEIVIIEGEKVEAGNQ